MKKFIGLLVLVGALNACSSATLKADVQAGIAAVRSGALLLKGTIASVRSNAATEEEILKAAQALIPPGTDLSTLDLEAQTAVEVIRTSTDRQLLEQAADTIIAHVKK